MWGSMYCFTSIYGQAYCGISSVPPIPPLHIVPAFRPGQYGRTDSKPALLWPALALWLCQTLVAAESCTQPHERRGHEPGLHQEKNLLPLVPLPSPPRESGRVKSSSQYEAHAAINILTTIRVMLVAVVNTTSTSYSH